MSDNNLDRLRASQAGGVPAGWMDMADAPRTRPIIVLTAGGRIIKAKWVIIGDDAVGWGTPDEDDPHPNCWHTGFCWASNEDEEPSDPPVGWIEIPSASPPPPATDGDALREALSRFLLDEPLPDGEDCPLCGGTGELDAYTADRTDTDYVGCPACLAQAHHEIARDALASSPVTAPQSDGDALREALVENQDDVHSWLTDYERGPGYICVPLHHIERLNRINLVALASSPPLAATDAVEAERRLREALAPLAAFATFMDKDAPDEAYLPATVPHISLTLGQARAAATLLGFPHVSDDPQFNGERLAAIRARETDEVENG